jgi:hypothetical protein
MTNKTGELLAETRGGRTHHPIQTTDTKPYHKPADTAETAQTGGCVTWCDRGIEAGRGNGRLYPPNCLGFIHHNFRAGGAQ